MHKLWKLCITKTTNVTHVMHDRHGLTKLKKKKTPKSDSYTKTNKRALRNNIYKLSYSVFRRVVELLSSQFSQLNMI